MTEMGCLIIKPFNTMCVCAGSLIIEKGGAFFKAS
jgi:hypothetical protein